jgi:arginine/lysine/ornithine decarboxylase
LHFDEAWLPHAAFHPFYGPYHAMGKKRARPKESMVYATQSIHKLLAGISQASHVLVQDAQNVKLDRHLFNEAYLMHTSTSPQYSIIASCDVAAAMMEPPGGTALVEESIAEALDFRRAMRKIDAEYGKRAADMALDHGDNATYDEFYANYSDLAEDSTDPMDHRGAVTDSFYESQLRRLKNLALGK